MPNRKCKYHKFVFVTGLVFIDNPKSQSKSHKLFAGGTSVRLTCNLAYKNESSFHHSMDFLLAHSSRLRCAPPATLRCPHGPPWRKGKLSCWVEVEDEEPGALRPKASTAEVWLAPCASSFWWSLRNGLLAAEKKKARIKFWMCNTTLRANSKRYSHKSHSTWLFKWTASQIKIQFSPQLQDRSLF